MKYYILSIPNEERVVISYLFRTMDGALLKRLKTVAKLYIPESSVKNQKQFISFVRSLAFNGKSIKIKLTNSHLIDKLSLVQYCELLFDSTAQELESPLSENLNHLNFWLETTDKPNEAKTAGERKNHE